MKSWIDKRLDDFYNKKGNEYLNVKIFGEIFDRLETKEYKIDNPDLYFSELMRIRDLHNTFMYALEEGYKKRMTSYKRQIVYDMINDGFDMSIIGEIIGGTSEDINKLKE